MADDGEQFIPHEYAIAEWAQTIRRLESHATGWMQYLANGSNWTMNEPKVYQVASTAASLQNSYNSHNGNFSQATIPQSVLLATLLSAFDIALAKAIYWVLVPLLQYACAVVLADTFQYFTHRAFHVNKWLYSELQRDHSLPLILTNMMA